MEKKQTFREGKSNGGTVPFVRFPRMWRFRSRGIAASESPGCFVPGRYGARQFLATGEPKAKTELRICCVRNTGASRVPERNSPGWSEHWTIGISNVGAVHFDRFSARRANKKPVFPLGEYRLVRLITWCTSAASHTWCAAARAPCGCWARPGTPCTVR